MANVSVGEWNIDIKQPCCISANKMNCICSALNKQTGSNYEILLYLGSQSVSGTNYMLLCKQISVTNPPEYKIVTVEIYKSISGECSITAVKTII